LGYRGGVVWFYDTWKWMEDAGRCGERMIGTGK